jgi:hypothetical protein
VQVPHCQRLPGILRRNGIAAPSSKNVVSIADLESQLASPETRVRAENFLARPRRSADRTVTSSVEGTTFRALHRLKFGIRPSALYRAWARRFFASNSERFFLAADAKSYGDQVIFGANDLVATWSESVAGRHDIGFGRAAKLLNLTLNLRYSPAPRALGVGLPLGDIGRLLRPFRAAGAQFPLPPPSRRRPDVVVLPARGFTLVWAGS